MLETAIVIGAGLLISRVFSESTERSEEDSSSSDAAVSCGSSSEPSSESSSSARERQTSLSEFGF